jgi:SAM-dependent methyltransferase
MQQGEMRPHISERVTQNRWEEAQKWELSVWVARDRPLVRLLRSFRNALARRPGQAETGPCDDWNHWWASRFEYYQALPSSIERAIEIGCGPYTNMRLICERVQIKSIICSDPLAEAYVQFATGWLSLAHRQGLVQINSQPIEELDVNQDLFDLVVMINVLDHVRDAVAGMQNAMALVKPQGYFVLGQDLTNAEDLVAVESDRGHPIRVDKEWLDGMLGGIFEPLMYSVLPREAGRNPRAHYGTYLFIGRNAP